jgi:serine/arginine repetitive matrix protein 2
MSASRYTDNNRYQRERSPFRDRRHSTYVGGYPPRGSEGGRPNADAAAFPPRDVPRGPKGLPDAPRAPPSGPPSGVPSGPRDGRGRGFAGRGDGPPSLRDAPPLTTATHNSRDRDRDLWRADRDRGDRERDRDFRERRPSPPRRSPVRDAREFPPRLDISRARRNSRDGPPSAGSTYSDPPLGSASTYRGSGIGRGRGGRDFGGDFRPRGRGYNNDERERHHDPRDRVPDRIADRIGDRIPDRVPDRSYRPRSRSRDPVRRDARDDREFDRRERDERRFERREDEPRRYDSYQGSASLKPASRTLDTHRSSVTAESRSVLGNTAGPPTPHSAHPHPQGDRFGPSIDSYSRRSSLATEPQGAKDALARRESDRNDLIASRAEFSKERYAPRASSPPAAVPAFGFSNVWRNPALDAKPAPTALAQKPIAHAPPVSAPIPQVAPAVSLAPKPSIPSGLSTVPPTGPKADRVSDRSQADIQSQENKLPPTEQLRPEPPSRPPPIASGPAPSTASNLSGKDNVEPKSAVSTAPPAAPLPQVPLARNRPPPTGPQAALRANVSPSFSRPLPPPFQARDASPGVIPSGPRNAISVNTSPKNAPISIPTGPKADRANPMAPRASMYPGPDRPPFSGPRVPMAGGPKSMQWVRPGLNRAPAIPAKREFVGEDRERAFGNAPKAPKLEGSVSAPEVQRTEQFKPQASSIPPPPPAYNPEIRKERATSEQPPPTTSPKPAPIESRRLSNVSMPDVSPKVDKHPVSATTSAPEILEDSDDDLDLDEDDFAESEARYNREKALLEAKLIDLSASHLRAVSPLQEIMLLASLTIEHLPRQESGPVDEEMASPLTIPPPAESAAELLTPKAEEEPEEAAVEEEKQEKSLAPATRALRLRQEVSVEREATPADLSSLPYLGSGPPTPLSDPDQERPSVSESVLLAIRTNLHNEISPEQDPDEILRQYASAYKGWRLSIEDLDDERDQEDQERQPSIEIGVKVTTPEVQNSAMAAMLDIPPATTGRRGHSNRFATEFDLEMVIKESLKTAEEERMGKRDKEMLKQVWDPEKEATVPVELTEYEAQRRRFVDTNFQREPGQGIFVYHYEPPEDDFTEVEHRIMVQHYRDQYAKRWGKLAEILHKEVGTSRTYKDTINHYYATKWDREYKNKPRRRGGARRGLRRGRGGVATTVDRSETQGDGPQTLTDSGRPRRQAAPTFGTEIEFDIAGGVPTPGRQRRQTDAEGTQEKGSRRGKLGKEKVGRKPKSQALAGTAAGSPLKIDRKERPLGVKSEEEFGRPHLGEMPMSLPPGLVEDQFAFPSDPSMQLGMPVMAERARSHTNSRPGPSSYWSVTEQNDFAKNVAHFGTDWAAIATHMGTKTQTMVKNQYLRLIESGQNAELQTIANETDKKRDRGEDLGPPPTPTPAPKRRYDNTTSMAPRTIAPTPEMSDSLKSPSLQPTLPPKYSPPLSSASRFPALVQAPSQVKPLISASGSTGLSESSLAAVPSLPRQQSPPAQQPRMHSQPHNAHSHAQSKPHLPGPRAGYFSDDLPPRVDNRPHSQSSSMMQPGRSQQQPPPAHTRPQEQAQPPQFRGSLPKDRGTMARPESHHDHNAHTMFQSHSRRISEEFSYPRQLGATQAMPHMRLTPGTGSPSERSFMLHAPRQYQPMQPNVQHPPASTQQIAPRSNLDTPPMAVKEEPPVHNLPPAVPHTQPPPPTPAPPSTFSAASHAALHSTQPPPSKPVVEPRKSNLLSLLNDPEPDEPRHKKPADALSHTPTPQQQAPVAVPPPSSVAQPPPQRRDTYSDIHGAHHQFSRPAFGQQTSQAQGPSRQVVDLTNEQSGSRLVGRDNWQQRQAYHSGQSQAPSSVSLNSPRLALAQPAFNNHRTLFAQYNDPRHNPSPPPLSAYNNSPHMHSRTPSLSGPASQQTRHALGSSAPAHSSPAPSASQILQRNPYAQGDPLGNNAQPPGSVVVRPSPHSHASHLAQQRDMQGRNDQSQAHNANLAYSNPQTTNEHHPGHLRGPSMAEPSFRRDTREYHHDFDRGNHDRDVSRELQQRTEVMIREHRESYMARPGASQPQHHDPRYQPPQPEHMFAPSRAPTPLSRAEHTQHLAMAHGRTHSLLGDGGHATYGQRPPDEQAHRYHDPFSNREERDRLTDRRQELAHQQLRSMHADNEFYARNREQREREMREREIIDRGMRDREMREQHDARLREELLRGGGRDGRMPGPPPPPSGGPPEQDQRPSAGPMDWPAAMPRHREGWQR